MRGRTFLKRALVIFAVCLAFGVGVWTGSRSQTLQEAAPAQTEPPQESVSVQPEPSAPAVVEPDKKPSAQSTPTSGFQAEAVEQQLKTKTHLYKNYGTWFVFLVVENTSEYTLDISVDAVARNAEGRLVGAGQDNIPAISAGASVVFTFLFDEEPVEVSYEFSIKEEKWFVPILQDLSYTSDPGKEKEILSVTNNGEKVAELVQGTVLFFVGDEVVGESTAYFFDDDYELKPGKTLIREMNCWAAYDSFEVYFSGWAE